MPSRLQVTSICNMIERTESIDKLKSRHSICYRDSIGGIIVIQSFPIEIRHNSNHNLFGGQSKYIMGFFDDLLKDFFKCRTELEVDSKSELKDERERDERERDAGRGRERGGGEGGRGGGERRGEREGEGGRDAGRGREGGGGGD